MSVVLRTDIKSEHIERMLKAAGDRAPVAIARALNKTGAPTSNAYMKQVKKTLGLKNWRYSSKKLGDVLKKGTSRRRAASGNLKYSLVGFGKGLPLAYYEPKETPSGATVNWLGTRKMIARSFYLSGHFPRRVKSKISESVLQRVGKGRWKLAKPLGPGVPEAMIQPAPRSTWEGNAASRLPKHVAHELQVILAGIA